MLSSLFVLALAAAASQPQQRELFDEHRQRAIPVEIALPVGHASCTERRKCKVALLSPGYGLGPGDYRFLSEHLGGLGYLVVSIQSVLPTDPELPKTGNAIVARTPMWQRGVDNLHYVRDALSHEYPQYDWRRLTLVGHSNGGDLSALALAQDPAFAKTLITLDHRRYPLPRNRRIRVLSIRGSDFPADPGVLPEPAKSHASATCIVAIPQSRHNDMQDAGPAWLKARIERSITGFLLQKRCIG